MFKIFYLRSALTFNIYFNNDSFMPKSEISKTLRNASEHYNFTTYSSYIIFKFPQSFKQK